MNRKIILTVAVTLDGFIEGPNGEIDWLVKDPAIDFGDILKDILTDVDAIFYGRISYEKWGNYLPGDHVSKKLKDAYDLLHTKKKYVFSGSKTSDGKATFINSNIRENVEKILQEPGKNIWLYGGGKLLTTFMNLNLVDVCNLAVHPVIIGKGKPLFNDIKHRVHLKLNKATPSGSGVILLRYTHL